MSRRVAVVLSALAILTALAGPAFSQGPPPHPHMLVLGLQLDAAGEPIGYRKCVDLAANQPVPNNAHHANLHTGRAADAQMRAGNMVVPIFPGMPFQNCADLDALFR